MIIGINGCEIEATPANAAIFTGETLLNGIYVDQDDDYVFIPEEVINNYVQVIEVMESENIPIYELATYDPEAQPFCFMINGLCRVFACEIEDTYGE